MLATKKGSDKLPQHRNHWQLLQKVRWLQRVDDPAVVLPVVGGEGSYVVDHFCGSTAWKYGGSCPSGGSSAQRVVPVPVLLAS